MTNKNTDGPAFPSLYVYTDRDGEVCSTQISGMTLRDYFIAHAPKEPQKWFRPHLRDCPPSKWASEDGKRVYETYTSACKAEGDEFVIDLYSEERQAWKDEFAKAIYTQWPAAWADEMIKERNVWNMK